MTTSNNRHIKQAQQEDMDVSVNVSLSKLSADFQNELFVPGNAISL